MDLIFKWDILFPIFLHKKLLGITFGFEMLDRPTAAVAAVDVTDATASLIGFVTFICSFRMEVDAEACAADKAECIGKASLYG